MYSSIATTIGNALRDRFGVSKEVTLKPPEAREHGDLTTNVALVSSKDAKKSPRELAEAVVEALQSHPDVAGADIAGPGFINIRIRPETKMNWCLEAGKACTPKKPTAGDPPVIVEYSQPNIAKPMGIHHILSTVIGQCLVNLYRHAGYRVIAWNYIGDWGTQFGNLAVAVQKWGNSNKKTKDYTLDELLALYVRFHREAENNPELEKAGRETFRKLEQGDRELRGFWEDVVSITKSSLAALYERLHVSFDEYKGESFYEDKMERILEEGKNKGVFTKGREGALVVEFPEGVGLPTFMVLKSDGATLYATRELAMVRDRAEHFHPQTVLYVVDVAQTLYFQQLFKTVEMLGWDAHHLEHVMFGRMRFRDESMSTRKGTVLKLEEVLDEAVKRADRLIGEHQSDVTGKEREKLAEMMGVGSVVYVMLSQNRKQTIIFTWEKALTFEGNSAPYLQYTHARARSVLRKGNITAIPSPKGIERLEKEEESLMLLLARFPHVLEEARSEALPHKLCNYLYELCRNFNSFYNIHPILSSEGSTRDLRLALTALTADVLKCGAELLTLRVPDRM